MIKKVSHIGIAVKDINKAILFFKQKFGLDITDQDIGGGFHVAFLPGGKVGRKSKTSVVIL
jgi:catechol 2,3-dioxygenase-like lactoylglutathione lyase family enzyme